MGPHLACVSGPAEEGGISVSKYLPSHASLTMRRPWPVAAANGRSARACVAEVSVSVCRRPSNRPSSAIHIHPLIAAAAARPATVLNGRSKR